MVANLLCGGNNLSTVLQHGLFAPAYVSIEARTELQQLLTPSVCVPERVLLPVMCGVAVLYTGFKCGFTFVEVARCLKINIFTVTPKKLL
jgi:hypothetical protein